MRLRYGGVWVLGMLAACGGEDPQATASATGTGTGTVTLTGSSTTTGDTTTGMPTTGDTTTTGTGVLPTTGDTTTATTTTTTGPSTSDTGSTTMPDPPPPVFPADPQVEPPLPPTVPPLFGDPGEMTGGPCLTEPGPGTMLPKNWLRPRFRWVPAAGQNLFELRIHLDGQANDLVVYTDQTAWTMPQDMWEDLRALAVDQPLALTAAIRGAVYDGVTLTSPPALGSTDGWSIAPAAAEGSIVFWTTSGGSALKGFVAGEESVALVLQPPQVQQKTTGQAQVTCIGCHTSTPDGLYASFTAQGPWTNVLAGIEAKIVGQQASFLGAGGLAALQSNSELGIHAYSPAHWQDGDRVQVTPMGSYAQSKLAWIDLEAAMPGQGVAWDYIARNGDPRGVGTPTWSRDGATIVYVSTDVQTTGRLDNGWADLYRVPYNDRLGGDATPIPGASDPGLCEYYPAYSPDDAMLAFNRVPMGVNMYNAAAAELFVIPAEGGDATRLAANDPVACTGVVSPGVTNSWPKWAPEAAVVGGRTYYWLVFSSTRGAAKNPQLYLTGVTVEGPQITTHGAVYLWNQNEGENNHTPAWDVFQIAPG